MAEAFTRHAGIDLLGTVSRGRAIAAALAAAAEKAGIAIADDDSWGDIFSRILAERIEPHLGLGRATILYEYPLPNGGAGAAEAGE